MSKCQSFQGCRGTHPPPIQLMFRGYIHSDAELKSLAFPSTSASTDQSPKHEQEETNPKLTENNNCEPRLSRRDSLADSIEGRVGLSKDIYIEKRYSRE